MAGWAADIFRAICFNAPYFSTIAPRLGALDVGRCEVRKRDRRSAHNDTGTVHAIALGNLAALSAERMAEIAVPSGMRWVPRGMTTQHLAKARRTMHAMATPQSAVREAETGYLWPMSASVRDDAGLEVFRAQIDMWASPRPRR